MLESTQGKGNESDEAKELDKVTKLIDKLTSKPHLFPRTVKVSSLKDFDPILVRALNGDTTDQPTVVDEDGNPYYLGNGMLWYETEDECDILVYFGGSNDFDQYFESVKAFWDRHGPATLKMKTFPIIISGRDGEVSTILFRH